MRLKIMALLTLTTLFSLPLLANAATYNWYFSTAGNDFTGDGSIGTPWRSLAKAQTQINTLTGSDTATLYFNRGDTWTVTPPDTSTGYILKLHTATITLDAYGAGNKPVFDAQEDFADNPLDDSHKFWDHFIEVAVNNCTISNLEIKNHYGNGIYVYKSGEVISGLTVSNCVLHNLGEAGINKDAANRATACIIEHNEVYDCQRNYELGHLPFWGGGITITNSGSGISNGHIIRYNYVHDIHGEGIIAAGDTVVYNIVENTRTAAIYAEGRGYDQPHDTIIAYNLVIGTAGGYIDTGWGRGIQVMDEAIGGTITGDIDIYGNTVIGLLQGINIRKYPSAPDEVISGTVRIYNNTMIDCLWESIYIDNEGMFEGGVYIYTNSSIQSDQAHAHVSGNGDHANVTISHNHFYPVDGTRTVLTSWQTDYNTADPKLPGEGVVDWDDLTSASDIDFDTHLYPPADSALVDNGKTLSAPYQTLFLSTGTDYNDLPSTATFKSIIQTDHRSKWDMGATIHDFNAGPDIFLQQPANVKIKPK